MAYTADAEFFYGMRNEIHADVPCETNCRTQLALQRGARVTLAEGGLVTGIDFELSPGGRLTGTVVDADSGAPLPGVAIGLVRGDAATPEFATFAISDSNGRFSAIGLSTGAYHLVTFNDDGYVDVVYPGLSCGGECDTDFAVLGGTVTVREGASTGGIVMALKKGGRIAGRVTGAVSGQAVRTSVYIYNRERRLVSRDATDANGDYLTRAGLPDGSYHAVAESTGFLMNEIFGNIPCTGNCETLLAGGTPIEIAGGAIVTGRDFALERGGSISGSVTREDNGLPAVGGGLDIYNAAGQWTADGYVDVDGTWYLFDVLPAGTYYAASVFTPGLVDERYDNMPCAADFCSAPEIMMGAPITVTAGATTTGIDFALAAESGVPGPPRSLNAVTDARGVVITWLAPVIGGAPLSYIVEAGLAPGAADMTLPAAETALIVPAVPPGHYYLRVRGINAAGTGVASREFELTVGEANLVAPSVPTAITTRVVGRRVLVGWTAPAGGGPALDYVMQVGTASGLNDIAEQVVTAPAFTFEPVPDGVYFIRVRARNAAGVSAPSEEAMLVVGGVPAPPSAPFIDTTVVTGSTVTILWLPPMVGPVDGYLIDAGTLPGSSDVGTLTVGNVTSHTVSGVPPGTYYVRIRAFNARGSSVARGELIVRVP